MYSLKQTTFEFFNIPLEQSAIELNEISKYCYQIEVLNSIIKNKNIVLLLKLTFKGPNSERDYKLYYKKQ